MARQRTVLLVAKAGLVRTVTSAGLNVYGYCVLTADSAEAVEALQANPRIDVVVIDLDAAGTEQGAALARLGQRLNPKTDNVYTSKGPHRVAGAIRGGGAPILRDPYHPHQLADVIAHLRFRSTAAMDVDVA